ncbi:hypothetical protein ACS0TY_034052 [Phlomoides rotata]
MRIGMVLLDDNEEFIACKSFVILGVYAVELGEAIGVYEALSWIKGLGMERVVVKMDAKLVFDGVTGVPESRSIFGNVIETCKILMNSLEYGPFNLVKRDANVIAHSIARTARSFPSIRPLWRAFLIFVLLANN